MSQAVLKRESCPQAADCVKRSGAPRFRGPRRCAAVSWNVQKVHDSCDIHTHHPIG